MTGGEGVGVGVGIETEIGGEDTITRTSADVARKKIEDAIGGIGPDLGIETRAGGRPERKAKTVWRLLRL